MFLSVVRSSSSLPSFLTCRAPKWSLKEPPPSSIVIHPVILPSEKKKYIACRRFGLCKDDVLAIKPKTLSQKENPRVTASSLQTPLMSSHQPQNE